MPEKITPRIAWIDLAKGIVIILMVLGHVIIGRMDLNKFIFIFHMPFFFIMAGFLLNLDKWGGGSKLQAVHNEIVQTSACAVLSS